MARPLEFAGELTRLQAVSASIRQVSEKPGGANASLSLLLCCDGAVQRTPLSPLQDANTFQSLQPGTEMKQVLQFTIPSHGQQQRSTGEKSMKQQDVDQATVTLTQTKQQKAAQLTSCPLARPSLPQISFPKLLSSPTSTNGDAFRLVCVSHPALALSTGTFGADPFIPMACCEVCLYHRR